MKKVSILVPVYNTGERIKKCLDSLLNQTYQNIEIVIANDGSTDDTENIIKEYIEKYADKISYYYKENTGVADTRNFLLEKAKGEYVLFIDSDDYIDLDIIESVRKYIEKDIDLIKFKLIKVDDNGNLLEGVQGPVFDAISGQEGFNRLYHADVLLDSPCLYITKKSIYIDNNLKFVFRTQHEDFGIIPLVILNAKTFVSTNYFSYYYIQSEESITRNENYEKTISKCYDCLKHYDNMLKRIEASNLNQITKENVRIYYTNAILLRTLELKKEDRKEYIKEIRKRKMISNIKIRNTKQLVKRIILTINVRAYLYYFNHAT